MTNRLRKHSKANSDRGDSVNELRNRGLENRTYRNTKPRLTEQRLDSQTQELNKTKQRGNR